MPLNEQVAACPYGWDRSGARACWRSRSWPGPVLPLCVAESGARQVGLDKRLDRGHIYWTNQTTLTTAGWGLAKKVSGGPAAIRFAEAISGGASGRRWLALIQERRSVAPYEARDRTVQRET